MPVDDSDDESNEIFQTTLRRVLVAVAFFSAALALAKTGFANNRPELAIAALVLTFVGLCAIFRRPVVAFAFLPVILIVATALVAAFGALMAAGHK